MCLSIAWWSYILEGRYNSATYISILNYDGWFRFWSLLSQGRSTFNNHRMWGESQNLYEKAARKKICYPAGERIPVFHPTELYYIRVSWAKRTNTSDCNVCQESWWNGKFTCNFLNWSAEYNREKTRTVNLAFPLCSSLIPLQVKRLLLVLQGRVVIFTDRNYWEIIHNRKGYNFSFLEKGCGVLLRKVWGLNALFGSRKSKCICLLITLLLPKVVQQCPFMCGRSEVDNADHHYRNVRQFQVSTAYEASASVLKASLTYELTEDVQELGPKHIEAIINTTLFNKLVLNIMHSLRRD